MGDVIRVAALFGIPFAIFIWANWRREQREREHQRGPDAKHEPPDRYRRSYWGSMGRPGR